MNIRELRIIYVTLYILSIATLLYPFALDIIEREQDKFISLTILDENKLMHNYYPDNNSITIGEEINWSIIIQNKMDDISYIAVKVIIVDSQTYGPNANLLIPTQREAVYQVYRIVLQSEEVLLPFSWEISEIAETGTPYSIKKIMINGDDINVNINLYEDLSGKIIFEIWKYDGDTEDFQFKVDTGADQVCIWSQLHFRIKP